MMIEVKASLYHDRNAAMEATRFRGALGLTPKQKAGVEDPVEMQRLADGLSVEQTPRRFIVSTDPDEHVGKIKAYIGLGFNHLVFHRPRPGPGEVPPPLRRGDPAAAARNDLHRRRVGPRIPGRKAL